MDKLHAEANWVKHPALKSIDDLENYPDFIEKLPKIQEDVFNQKVMSYEC